MSRVFLFVVLLAVLAVFVIVASNALRRVIDAGQKAFGATHGQQDEGLMVPTPYQKITYAALVVLLFGVATGWLGGL